MNDKSPHILNASSNLLGLTFLLLTSIKGLGLAQTGYVDDIVAFCVVAFAASTCLSFMSIRSKSEKSTVRYEQVADYMFLSGLTILLITSILFAFDILTFA